MLLFSIKEKLIWANSTRNMGGPVCDIRGSLLLSLTHSWKNKIIKFKITLLYTSIILNNILHHLIIANTLLSLLSSILAKLSLLRDDGGGAAGWRGGGSGDGSGHIYYNYKRWKWNHKLKNFSFSLTRWSFLSLVTATSNSLGFMMCVLWCLYVCVSGSVCKCVSDRVFVFLLSVFFVCACACMYCVCVRMCVFNNHYIANISYNLRSTYYIICT